MNPSSRFRRLRFPAAVPAGIVPAMSADYDPDEVRAGIVAFLRRRPHLKPKPWAVRAKVAVGTVPNFMRGSTKSLTYKTLAKLAAAEDVSVEVIVGRARDPLDGGDEADTAAEIAALRRDFDHLAERLLSPRSESAAGGQNLTSHVVASDPPYSRVPLLTGDVIVGADADQLGRIVGSWAGEMRDIPAVGRPVFTLVVKCDCLGSIYKPGTLIVVDFNDTLLRPGKRYLIVWRGDTCVREWRRNGVSAFHADSNSPSHNGPEMPEHEVTVRGRVVQATIFED